MIVLRSNFQEVVEVLRGASVLSLDTETTGLRPYNGDRLFSVIIGGAGGNTWYFNFQVYQGLTSDEVLTPSHLDILNKEIFSRADLRWYMHNAKFDLAILAQENCEIVGEVFCTKALGRVENNSHMDYDLDSSLKRIGFQKTFDAKGYCDEHELWTWAELPGRKNRKKLYHFDRIPYDLITSYGVGDGAGTFSLGSRLELSIDEQTLKTPSDVPGLQLVRDTEVRLTRTVFGLEKVGVRIDRGYCVRAAQYETDRSQKASEAFKRETGREYSSSPKLFAEIFSGERDRWSFTDKGNPSFDEDALRRLESPAAKLILELRDAKSKADFYNGFLYHADDNGDVHPTFNPDGARHGRFSSSNPNFQNLTAEESEEDLKEEFLIRRAIIPRPGFFFIMPDYDQMEYRLMLELADDLIGWETPIVSLIKGGLDVHAATVEVAAKAGVKITRTEAKTSNFLTLYGGGNQKLADGLKCSLEQAGKIRDAIFTGAPEIKNLIWSHTRAATQSGFVTNWHGRKNWFPDSRFAYKATNYLVSGGCADVVKIAMNRIDDYLKDKKSRMVLTIHDELPCEIAEGEMYVVPEIKKIMEDVFKSKYLPLTCGVEWSEKNLADKKKGLPT